MDIYATTMFDREKKIQIFKELKAQGGKTAADCIACGECMERCPFKLPIPDIMEKITAMFELEKL
jgi:predicted aldo/keto reductase-like oxidoreductase